MNIVFAGGDISRLNGEHSPQVVGLRGRRRGGSEEMRARLVEREARMVEMENRRIDQLNARMEQIRGLGFDEDLTQYEVNKIREARSNLLDMIAEQIARIYEKRAQREAAAMEMEAREMQSQLEERIREREEQAQEMAQAQQEAAPPTREEALQVTERNLMRNFARVDAGAQAIHELTRVRGARSMEALLLRHAVDHEAATTEDFRSRHLRALEAGIARLDEAVLHRITDMYRDSQREWVAYREDLLQI